MEFRVNTYSDDWQSSSDVTVLTTGDIVVVWDSYFNQGNVRTYYIAMQRFTADGTPLGSETVVSNPNREARYARVEALADGGFAVAWEAAPDYFVDDTQIYTRSYTADGIARGNIVQVNPTGDDHYGVDIVRAGDGYRVFYTGEHIDFTGDPEQDEVYSVAFSADGTATGGEINISGVLEWDQQVPRTAELSNGDIVVVWESENTSFTDRLPGESVDDRMFQIYSPDGVARTPVQIFSHTEINGTFNLAKTDTDVAALLNGHFVIVWKETVEGDEFFEFDHQIRGMIFNSNGAVVRGEFVIASYDDSVPGQPVVEGLSGGGFVVAWDVPSQLENVPWEDVDARVFYENGDPYGNAFLVPQNFALEQLRPSIAATQDGGFIITYDSESIDPDDTGIAARLFDAPVGLAQGLVFNGDGGSNAILGEAGDDTISGFGGDDLLRGGYGDDRITGGANLDIIAGGVGNDSMSAGASDDILVGGPGNDTMIGGAGDDFFVFDLSQPTGNDLIRDYDAAFYNAVTRSIGPGDLIYVEGSVPAPVQDGAFLCFGNVRVEGVPNQNFAFMRSNLSDLASELERGNTAHIDTISSYIFEIRDFGTEEAFDLERVFMDADLTVLAHEIRYDSGLRIDTDFDSDSSRNWDTIVEYFEDSARYDRRVNYDDNTQIRTLYDSDSNDNWETILEYRDAANELHDKRFNYDNGTQLRTLFDTDGTQTWANVQEFRNASNQLYDKRTNYDDDSQLRQIFDVASNSWESIQEYRNAANQLYDKRTNYDDGTQTRTVFDVPDNNSWDAIIELRNSENELFKKNVNFDNGNYQIVLYDVEGTETWNTYARTFDADDNLLSTVFT